MFFLGLLVSSLDHAAAFQSTLKSIVGSDTASIRASYSSSHSALHVAPPELSSLLDAMGDASMLLAEEAKKAAPTVKPVDFGASFGANALIMFTLLSVLVGGQKLTDYLRFSIPVQLRPVVDSVLTQIAGLGIVTLALQSALEWEVVNKALKDISKAISSSSGVQISISGQNIDLLQHGFMELGVAATLATALMIYAGLNQLRDIEELQQLTLDPNSGQCNVDADVLAAYLSNDPRGINKPKNKDPLPGNISVWREIFRNPKERAARTLVMRIKIMELYPYLPNTFRVESLILESFANNLYQVTQFLSRNPVPLFVAFFIPSMAVVNAILASKSAFGSPLHVGDFVTNPVAVWPATFSVVVGGIWGNWNCYKMTQIKKVTLPRLSLGSERFPTPNDYRFGRAYNQNEDGPNDFDRYPRGSRPAILTPLMDDPGFRQYYDVSGNEWTERIERIWAKPARNWFDAMFGTAGAAGLDLYRNSIQYQVGLCLTQLIVFGTMICPRDIELLAGVAGVTQTATTLSLAKAELLVYGGFAFFTTIQLFLVAPRAFWNLCLVSCLQEDGLNAGDGPGMGGGALPPSQQRPGGRDIRGVPLAAVGMDDQRGPPYL